MLNKILQIFVIVAIAAGLILALLTVLDFDGTVCTDCWQFENLIAYCYILTGVLVAASLFGAAIGIVKKPESLKTMIIGIVGFALLFGISYGMASDEIPVGLEVSKETMKLSDTGLIAMYITMGLSASAILFSSVMKLIRR